ncbi:rep protein [Mycolicibacter icosiumassiliensis]|uniref:rep protein n=1 Tax=Mycolicibacter icosiumassiliensis TaxID=1792835 RepID=UPI000A666A37|nr:rep protein [Mycolicibacter icosiumassiliensis]
MSITAATLVAIATVMAGHADHATGRHVAITRATIATAAGCSPDTVTVAWRVLRVAGWAVEAQRGHGSPTTPTVGRRPSIYHLTPHRPSTQARHPQPVHHTVGLSQVVEFPDLPRSGAVSTSSPVGTHSPSAHPRARQENPRPKKRATGRTGREPRPLALQRLAAGLIAGCHGLGHGHAGAICDVLSAAGIDPTVWSARQITTALNTDMAATGFTWPDRISCPAAFLASRLKRIDWTPPAGNDGGYAAGPDTKTAPRPAATTTGTTTPIPQESRWAAQVAARAEHAQARTIARAALGGPGHTAARTALTQALAATRRRTTAPPVAPDAETAPPPSPLSFRYVNNVASYVDVTERNG